MRIENSRSRMLCYAKAIRKYHLTLHEQCPHALPKAEDDDEDQKWNNLCTPLAAHGLPIELSQKCDQTTDNEGHKDRRSNVGDP